MRSRKNRHRLAKQKRGRKRTSSEQGTSVSPDPKQKRRCLLTNPRAYLAAALITGAVTVITAIVVNWREQLPEVPSEQCALTRDTVFEWVVIDANFDFPSSSATQGKLRIEFEALAENLAREVLTWVPELDDLANATSVSASIASQKKPSVRQVLSELKDDGVTVGYRAPPIELEPGRWKRLRGTYEKTIGPSGVEWISVARPVMEYMLVRVHAESPNVAGRILPVLRGSFGIEDKCSGPGGLQWSLWIQGPHSGPSVALLWGVAGTERLTSSGIGPTGPLATGPKAERGCANTGAVATTYMTAWSREPDTVPRPEATRVYA